MLQIDPKAVGARVQDLLDSHGDSYLDAEKKTTVCRETIRRICLGFHSPKLRKYLRLIAEGYGIDDLSLLEGASPKAEFEWFVRQAAPSQRLEWLLMTPSERTKLTCDFIRAKYPASIPLEALAAACGRTPTEMKLLLARWDATPPDRRTALVVAKAVHNFVGVSMRWFICGYLADQWAEPASCLPLLCAHVHMKEPASTSEGIAALSRLIRLD